MEKQEIVMEIEKETKNTVRYDAVQNGEPPACKNVYIQKWALGEDIPEKVEVSIEEAE